MEWTRRGDGFDLWREIEDDLGREIDFRELGEDAFSRRVRRRGLVSMNRETVKTFDGPRKRRAAASTVGHRRRGLTLFAARLAGRVRIGRSDKFEEIRGAAGRIRLKKIRLDDVTVGEAEWSRVTGLVLEGPSPAAEMDGVLGPMLSEGSACTWIGKPARSVSNSSRPQGRSSSHT